MQRTKHLTSLADKSANISAFQQFDLRAKFPPRSPEIPTLGGTPPGREPVLFADWV